MVIDIFRFNKGISPFNNMKLHNKLILSHILVALLPVVIIGYFLVSKTIDIAFSNAESINLTDSKQMQENIINQLDSFLEKADNTLNITMLMNYIQLEHDYQDDYLTKYNDYRKIIDNNGMSLPFTPFFLTTYKIYSTNSTIIYDNSFFIPIDSTVQSQQWFKNVSEAKGNSIILPPNSIKGDPLLKEGTPYIHITKTLNPFLRNNITNVLRVDIPESELYKLIEKNAVKKNIYILNNQNLIVSSTDRNSLGKASNSIAYLNDILQNSTENEMNKLDKNNNFISYKKITDKSSINGWKIVSIVPSTTMSNSISSIVKYSVLIIAISIIATVLFVFYLSKTLTVRLKELTNNMSKIDEGNFEVFADYTGNDEIAILTKSFKKMIEKVNTLINEVYLLDIEKKQAEINALQSQINPHFLFNTMESIRMNLLKKKDYENSEIIQKFAKLLRKTIDWKADKLPLKQELELIETYLNIQKYRYKDKFTFEIRIDEDLEDYVIPKFSLQPIVENAIYHGIEMKKGTGKLEIYSEIQDNFLKIIVKDDGVGIENEKLELIKAQLSAITSQYSKDSIGIWNVHQRLRISFGPEYGLNVESKEGFGTTFELLLPKPVIKEN